MRRILSVTVFTMLAGFGLLAVPPVGAGPAWSASPPVAESPGSEAEPTGGLTVGFSAAPGTHGPGSDIPAKLGVAGEQPATSVRISISTTGPVQLKSPATAEVRRPAVGGTTTVPASFRVTGPGQGTIRATATSFDANGAPLATTSHTLFVTTARNQVLQSTSGVLDLAVQAVRLERSRLSDAQYQAALDRALAGGPAGGSSPATGAQPKGDVAAAGPVTVAGKVEYKDSAGAKHPVRRAAVEIRDEEAIGSALVTTVNTNDAGDFTATVDNDDGILQGGRDIFVRVLAKSAGFQIEVAGGGAVHRVESAAVSNVADGATVTRNVEADNVQDSHTAFAVHDALVTAIDYTVRIQGSRFGDLTVHFPSPAAASSFNSATNTAQITGRRRFDWDVILHEYGHFVAAKFSIDASPGGSHSFSSNMAETLGKDKGTKLAWSEGFATYFSIAAQQRMGTAAFGIPHVGNLLYDVTDNAPAAINVETQAGGVSRGEDDEAAVMRILWDLDDGASDNGDDRGVGFGDLAVLDKVKGVSAKTLSTAFGAFNGGQPPRAVANMGCILTEHKVAPKITAPSDNSLLKADEPPEIKWDKQGAGPSNLNDKFVVQFYSAAFDKLLFESPEQAGTTFKPTAAQWKTIVQGAGPLVNVMVKGRQTNNPSTGPYTSCNVRLVAPKLDLIFVIDTTGSMFDDIDAVKAAGNEIVNTIADSGSDFQIGLVDYKDLYSSCGSDGYASRIDLAFSSARPAILSAVNALGARGGCDFPESVYSGLMTAIGFPWREGSTKAIILMGDAPPHDPEPVTGLTLASVIAAANAVAPKPAVEAAPAGQAAAPASPGGVSIYTIEIAHGASPFFQQLSDGTGGKHFDAVNASAVVGAILDAIGTIISGPPGDCPVLTPTLVGTDGPDDLAGTPGPDVIFGLGGNDRITGLGGDDVICGGDGNDAIIGGDGNDQLYGDAGDDGISGGLGTDSLFGGSGTDRLNGGGNPGDACSADADDTAAGCGAAATAAQPAAQSPPVARGKPQQ